MWTCSSIIKVPVQTFGNLTKDWLFVNQFKTKKECDITYNLRHAIYVYELHCEQIPSLLSPNCPYKWDVQNPFSGRKRRRRWRRKNQCGESTHSSISLKPVSSYVRITKRFKFIYQRIVLIVQVCIWSFLNYDIVLKLCWSGVKLKSFLQACTIPTVLPASRKNVYEKKAKNVAIE